jgi:long-subunit acyl-CoA synthetase (AMP-forming)
VAAPTDAGRVCAGALTGARGDLAYVSPKSGRAVGREAGERVEGRLEYKGPSATGGYYRNPEETRRLRA